MLRGGLQDIDVTMESPNKKLLYRGEKAVMDRFDFETSWGLYTICFSNEFSNIIHKVRVQGHGDYQPYASVMSSPISYTRSEFKVMGTLNHMLQQ